MMEEVGNGKFFDQIDNILDFDNDDVEDGLFGSGEVDIDSFPPVWLEESPVVSSAGHCNDASDLKKANRTARYEDMVQLEWLSHFFKDSLSKSKLLPICHAKRARSKRPRPASFNPRFTIQLLPSKKSFKQPKKKPKLQFQNNNHNNKDPGPIPLKKCTHCEITNTPQWREGPSGPRTLCNACGVRYKKGMLFPEYRPAASPTFVPSLHSNLYRKVIEMRKSKNEDEIVQPELFRDSNSHMKGVELIEYPSLHSNPHIKATELRKTMNENEIGEPELFRDSISNVKGLDLIEYPPLHSNSHRKVTKMKKTINENEIGQPELFQDSNSQMKGLELIEYLSLHSNSHRKVTEMRKTMNENEIGQLELLPDSNSHMKGLELRECPSLHSNSHRKVTEMKKSMNENEIVQPELLRYSNTHEEGLELVDCPISVITTDILSFLPELLPDITE